MSHTSTSYMELSRGVQAWGRSGTVESIIENPRFHEWAMLGTSLRIAVALERIADSLDEDKKAERRKEKEIKALEPFRDAQFKTREAAIKARIDQLIPVVSLESNTRGRIEWKLRKLSWSVERPGIEAIAADQENVLKAYREALGDLLLTFDLPPFTIFRAGSKRRAAYEAFLSNREKS